MTPRTSQGRQIGSRPCRPGEKARPLDLGATLSAATRRHSLTATVSGPLRLELADLHRQERLQRRHRLNLFVIDTSDSMGDGPLANMSAALGAAMALARDAYLSRDMISLVTFRDQGAQTVVAPTTSVQLLRQKLARLPVGGATPLTAGLQQAGQVIDQCRSKYPGLETLLILVSDGEGTVPARPGKDPQQECLATAKQLARRQIAALIIDTRPAAATGAGFMPRLAEAFGTGCHHIQHLKADKVLELINSGRTMPGTGRREE